MGKVNGGDTADTPHCTIPVRGQSGSIGFSAKAIE
jgi:hypothetical protein